MSSTTLYWLECSENALPESQEWLTPRESDFSRHLRTPKRRADWLLGRWAAKHAVAAYAGDPMTFSTLQSIEVLPTTSGAPEVFYRDALAPVALSLSHREGRALAVIAPATLKLGCDLEVIEPRSEAFVHDYFTAEECAAVAVLRSPEARMQAANLVWSAKESALKLLQTGLTQDTRSISIRYESISAQWNRLVATINGETFTGWWMHSDPWIKTVVASKLVPQPCALAVEPLVAQ